MNNLRWILLGIGIVIIAGIYLWETLRQRRARKRDFIPDSGDHRFPELHIKPGTDTDDDYSEALSDLNNLLVHKRRMLADKQVTEKISRNNDTGRKGRPSQIASTPDVDLKEESTSSARIARSELDEIPGAATNEPVFVFYVTAPGTTRFNGREVWQAAEMAGMEYGAMDIFHHFGVGHIHSEQPLFSMANMFEPGHFKADILDSLTTRGIVLFMYQPGAVDAQLVTELLLNTVLQLADLLGGEIRGGDHDLMTGSAITALRDKVRRMAR